MLEVDLCFWPYAYLGCRPFLGNCCPPGWSLVRRPLNLFVSWGSLFVVRVHMTSFSGS